MEEWDLVEEFFSAIRDPYEDEEKEEEEEEEWAESRSCHVSNSL